MSSPGHLYENSGTFLTSGDVDGDGLVDLIIGNPYSYYKNYTMTQNDVITTNVWEAGRVDIFLAGKNFSEQFVNYKPDASLRGAQYFEWFGGHVTVVKNVDQKRFLVVGSSGFNNGSKKFGKLSFFEIGKFQGKFQLNFVGALVGNDSNSRFGHAFAVGNPGLPTGHQVLAVSAPSQNFPEKSYIENSYSQMGVVWFIDFDSLLNEFTSNPILTLSSTFPSYITSIWGLYPFDWFGFSVGWFPAPNGPQVDLFYATAPYWDALWWPELTGVDVGALWVYNFTFVESSENPQVDIMWFLEGENARGLLGKTVCVKDLDNNGNMDFVVSAPRSDRKGLGGEYSGEVWVMLNPF